MIVVIVIIIVIIIIQLEVQESPPTKSLPVTHTILSLKGSFLGSCMFSADQGQEGEGGMEPGTTRGAVASES